MTLPDDRLFRKLFLQARREISRSAPDNNNIQLIHDILLECSLNFLEESVSTGVSDPGIFYSFLNSRLQSRFLAKDKSSVVSSFVYSINECRNYPSVVASLFELSPEQAERTAAKRNEKYGYAHSKRKRTGQFFTPLAIADFMCRSAIDSFIRVNPHGKKAIKILDPSIGAGIFPDAMFNILEEKGFSSREMIKGFRGIDCNEKVIEISRRVLAIKSGGKHIKPLNLMSGDFLLGELDHPLDGYDIVIGNPPYISYYSRESHADSELKKRLDKRYGDIAGGSLNTFLHFIVRGIELLAENGILCYIVPDRLLWNRRYGKLRKHILDTAPPIAIFTTGEKVFSDATVDSAVIILQKGASVKAGCKIGEMVFNRSGGEISIVNEKVVNPDDFLAESEIRFVIRHPLLSRMEKNAIPLKDIAHVRDGINPAFNEFRKRIISNEKEGNLYRPLIEGCDIHPFRINRRKLFINYDLSIVTPELRSRGVSLRQPWIFDSPLKLVNRQTADRLIFALDRNKLCDLNSVHNTILKKGIREETLYFLLGLMNSRLMNFYYRNMTFETAKNFPQVHIADLELLPVRIPPYYVFSDISQTAQRLTRLTGNREDLIQKIDDAFFDIYEISKKDRERIISSTGKEWRL